MAPLDAVPAECVEGERLLSVDAAPPPAVVLLGRRECGLYDTPSGRARPALAEYVCRERVGALQHSRAPRSGGQASEPQGPAHGSGGRLSLRLRNSHLGHATPAWRATGRREQIRCCRSCHMVVARGVVVDWRWPITSPQWPGGRLSAPQVPTSGAPREARLWDWQERMREDTPLE